MIVVTYCYGQFTGCLIVENWQAVFDCINRWEHKSRMTWMRVQYAPIIT